MIAFGGGTALAAETGWLSNLKHLRITEVFVNFDVSGDTLTTKGEDLDFGWRPLEVTLGDFGPLEITFESSTEIVVNCPPDGSDIPTCEDSDYLLTVSKGKVFGQTDKYDLTIGAVGPKCPAGPQGDPGISELEIVDNVSGSYPNFTRLTVECPAGKTVISCAGEARGVASILNGAFPDGNGCSAVGHQPESDSVELAVWTFCAVVQPQTAL